MEMRTEHLTPQGMAIYEAGIREPKKAMETIHVLLPEDVQDICSRTDLKKPML